LPCTPYPIQIFADALESFVIFGGGDRHDGQWTTTMRSRVFLPRNPFRSAYRSQVLVEFMVLQVPLTDAESKILVGRRDALIVRFAIAEIVAQVLSP
jgi:hypothetical protein